MLSHQIIHIWNTAKRNYSPQLPLGLRPSIFHFHSPHQPACCQGAVRTGSYTHEARGSGECCWSGGQWHCTPGVHILPPDGLHQHGNWAVRVEWVQSLRVHADCHRQKGRLKGRRERHRGVTVTWIMALACHLTGGNRIGFSPQQQGSCLILRKVKEVRVSLLFKVRLLWALRSGLIWAGDCGSQVGTTSNFRGVILKAGGDWLISPGVHSTGVHSTITDLMLRFW